MELIHGGKVEAGILLPPSQTRFRTRHPESEALTPARCPQDPTTDPGFLAQLSQVTLSWMVLSTVTSAAGNFT